MRITTWLATALAAGVLVTGRPVVAETKPDCVPAQTPTVVEGQVVKVDTSRNTVTVRGTDGTTHELQASRAAIEDFKVGDRIEANLRPGGPC
jgi:hypothetical protein